MRADFCGRSGPVLHRKNTSIVVLRDRKALSSNWPARGIAVCNRLQMGEVCHLCISALVFLFSTIDLVSLFSLPCKAFQKHPCMNYFSWPMTPWLIMKAGSSQPAGVVWVVYVLACLGRSPLGLSSDIIKGREVIFFDISGIMTKAESAPRSCLMLHGWLPQVTTVWRDVIIWKDDRKFLWQDIPAIDWHEVPLRLPQAVAVQRMENQLLQQKQWKENAEALLNGLDGAGSSEWTSESGWVGSRSMSSFHVKVVLLWEVCARF